MLMSTHALEKLSVEAKKEIDFDEINKRFSNCWAPSLMRAATKTVASK